MELRHLRYFVVVAEEENVTRAARRLHVSQPPLTRQIRDLEEELGVTLFERPGRSIRLTASGRLFLEKARGVLRCLEEAVKSVQASASVAVLQLGYAPSATAEVLPGLLRAVQRQAPGVRVVLHDLTSPEMLEALRDGALDAAVLMEPPAAAAGVVFEPLREYPLGVAVPRHHALAARKSVALAEVRAGPWVAYSRRDYPDYHAMLVQRVGAWFRRVRLAEECDGGPSLMAAVESGRGLCLIPSFIAHAAGRRLRFIPLVPAVPPSVLGVAHREGGVSAAVEAFLRCARSMVRPGARPR